MRLDGFFFCILRGPRRVSKVKDGERAGEVARAAEVQRGTGAFRRHGGVGERASESWKGERRERESRGAVEVWESRTKASGQGSRDRAPLAPSEGLTETHFGAGVRADQSLKGAGTYWKVKGLEKNMKESTIVMAFLPVVTAEGENKKSTGVTSCKTSSCMRG